VEREAEGTVGLSAIVVEVTGDLSAAVAALGDEEGWVQVGRAAALATKHRLCCERKVASLVWLSSVGIAGDVFGASSVATRSAHDVSSSDVFDVAVLVIGSISAVRLFLPLVLAL
jgi:hypothetical protein